MKATQSNITKKEIVDEIASQTGFTQVKTKVIVEGLIDAVTSSVIEGREFYHKISHIYVTSITIYYHQIQTVKFISKTTEQLLMVKI